MQKRFVSLLLKLSSTQAAIREETARPMPDWTRLFRLKRLRLRIKDAILSMMPRPRRQPQLAYARARNERSFA